MENRLPPPDEIDKDERVWAAFCHLSAFSVFLLFGFGHIVGPLAFWLLKRQESTFLDEQGKEAVNFQISISIYFLVSAMAAFLIFSSGFVVILLLGVMWALFWFVSVIFAAVKANDGGLYRYCLCIRFL